MTDETRPLEAQELRDWWSEAAWAMAEGGTDVAEHTDVFLDLAEVMYRCLIEERSVREGFRRMERILADLGAGMERATPDEQVSAMAASDSAIQQMALHAALMMSACLRTLMEDAQGTGVTPLSFRAEYVEEMGGPPWVAWYLAGLFGPLTVAQMVRPLAPTLVAMTEARQRLAFLYSAGLALVDAVLVARNPVLA